MRILILALSGLTLSACSMSGTNTSWTKPQTQNTHAKTSCYPNGCKTPYRQTSYATKRGSYRASAPNYGASPHPHKVSTAAAHAYGTHSAHTRPGFARHGGYNGPALRGPKVYGSLGAVNYDTDTSLYGIQARAGFDSGHILGAEFEASTGVIDDKISGFDVDNESSFGLFAVARVPVLPKVNVVGRAGYHITKFNTLGPAYESGEAYGGGLEYALSARDTLRADYTRYDTARDGLDAVSLAFQRRF